MGLILNIVPVIAPPAEGTYFLRLAKLSPFLRINCPPQFSFSRKVR